MFYRVLAAAAAASLGMAAPASATVAFYSTQAGFSAATKNPQATDGFETAPVKPGYVDYPASGYSGVGFKITTPANVYLSSVDLTYGAGLYDWASGDVMAYYSDRPLLQAVDVTFTFTAPVTAFSIDIMSGPPTSTVVIAGAGFSTQITTGEHPVRTFFGLTSTTGLTGFTMRTISPIFSSMGAIGQFDNFTIASARSAGAAPVPEPASWALMLAGFGLTGAMLRRRERSVVA